MLYHFYKFGHFLARILPIRISYFLADLAAVSYYIFCGKDKILMENNLRVVVGSDARRKVTDKYRFEVYRNFAKYLADFFRTPVFTREFITENIEISGSENIGKALEKGKGLIMTSMHFGNWEWGGAVISGLGYPIKVIALEHKDKRVDDFFVNQRKLNGIRSIPLGAGVKECFRALKRNEVIGIIGDKDYTSTGIPVKFCGKTAIIPKGPAVIALKTGAPIIVTILLRKNNDKFKAIFEEVVMPEATGDFQTDVENLMGSYLRIFEKYVHEYPGQWYAFRKIWV